MKKTSLSCFSQQARQSARILCLASEHKESTEEGQQTGLPTGVTREGTSRGSGTLQGGRRGAGEQLWGNAECGGKDGSGGRSGRKAWVRKGKGTLGGSRED